MIIHSTFSQNNFFDRPEKYCKIETCSLKLWGLVEHQQGWGTCSLYLSYQCWKSQFNQSYSHLPWALGRLKWSEYIPVIFVYAGVCVGECILERCYWPTKQRMLVKEKDFIKFHVTSGKFEYYEKESFEGSVR